MTYTPEERMKKLARIMAADPDCRLLEQEYWAEQEKFQRFVDRLPGFLRERLYGYPTLCYHYHQRIIALACENLRFPGEE